MLTRDKLRQLRTDLQTALANAGIEGFTFNVGNCSFNSAEATFKVTAALEGAETEAAKGLRMFARLHGLSTATNSCGETLVEYKSRSPKFPYVYVGRDGKRYKCSVAYAQTHFKS